VAADGAAPASLACHEPQPRSRPITRLASGLAAAHDLIDRHFARPVTIAELARAARCSRFHFMRAFQDAYGVTPGQHLRARRLQRARHLLTTTATPVTEVCRLVGYRSLGTFSRVFRAATGESPLAYRRRTRRRVYIPTCFTRMYRADR
jgi:AraC-like DNA-binding protein